ncbi:MAG TPA: TolC family protein [Bryobacteraceae bacterium]|nr:TolC family protein [Bryobacteraceae bacterium]
MRRSRPRGRGSAVMLLTVVTVYGQAPAPQAAQGPQAAAPSTQMLTLAQAVAIGIRNHPRIVAAQNDQAAAEQRVTETRAPYYPSLNAEITGSQGNENARLGAGSLSASRLFNREGEGLVVNQLISDFGRTGSLVASSRLQVQAAAQSTQAATYDVILGVNRAYFGVLEAQALVRVAQQTVAQRQTLDDQVTALGKAQLKSQVDVSFADVNLSEAQLALIRARDNLQQAFVDLNRALGQDAAPVQYQLAEGAIPAAPPASVEALVGEAVQNRPELADLRLRYQAAQKFEAAERDLKRPNVHLVAVGGDLPYLDEVGRTTPDGYEAVAVNVEIPIFNGHLFSAREQEARYQSLATNQRLRDLQQQVEHDVRGAWLTANTAFQRIPVTVDLVSQAQLAQDLAQGRYDLGLASIVELTQAQLNLTQAQIENVGAQYDYESAYAVLQYTIGALR